MHTQQQEPSVTPPACANLAATPLITESILEPLLPRVASGDAAAFSDCIERYKALVWWLARKHLGLDAEDAVQEVFFALWKNAARFNSSKATESTFVGMVARRRLIDMHRSRTRRPETEPIEEQWNLGVAAKSIEVAAEVSLALKEVAKLPRRDREVVRLSTALGMTHTEISLQLGLPLGTVKTCIRRSLLRIRAQLEAGLEVSDYSDQDGRS